MIKIVNQHSTSNGTIVSISERKPYNSGDNLFIAGVNYEWDIVYDMPLALWVKATGDFVGKEVTFA